MNDTAINVQHLSKRYTIGAAVGQQTFREALISGAKAPLRRMRSALRGSGSVAATKDFWALRDVSFEVKRGEVIGIIGRNGAGKSTLLKILSRITGPTGGYAEIHGRVGTLLEVGTGFHPELTGRENMYLNGAILGMSRADIDRKFDEIVAFAEVEQFIDTMVKHYSSGMYLRLAFAVAAHLEPEILIVDEVLAVGDAQFQRKCLGKMGEVAKEGRTVLFVSHDLSAINTLCQRAVLLNSGQIERIGPTQEVVRHYLNRGNQSLQLNQHLQNNDEIRLLALHVEQAGAMTTVVNCHQPFTVVLEYAVLQPMRGSRLFMLVKNERGEYIFGTSDYDDPDEFVLARPPGHFIDRIEVPGNLLKAETIYVTIGADIKSDRVIFQAEDALRIDVIESASQLISDRHIRVGAVAPLLRWQPTPVDAAGKAALASHEV
jgi:lipopolysaccharide transport system ATP-binding protein